MNSFCMQKFGHTSYISLILNSLFTIVLLTLIIIYKKTKYYGLVLPNGYKKFLFFLPLLVIASVPLWNGINTNNSLLDITFHILTMINEGFLEEMIFRGILFKSMEKDNKKAAIICHILINSLSVFSINS